MFKGILFLIGIFVPLMSYGQEISFVSLEVKDAERPSYVQGCLAGILSKKGYGIVVGKYQKRQPFQFLISGDVFSNKYLGEDQYSFSTSVSFKDKEGKKLWSVNAVSFGKGKNKKEAYRKAAPNLCKELDEKIAAQFKAH